MLLIQKNVASLSNLAAKDAGKYSMTGVSLTHTPDGGYQAIATNGRYLGEVTGPGEDFASFPSLPVLTAAPNGATNAVVPIKDWQAAFKAIPKPPKKGGKAELAQLAVVIGERQTTFAATDGLSVNSSVALNVEGRFPNSDSVFESTGKTSPRATVKLNAALLRELLAVAEQFSPDDTNGVTLEIRGENDPVVVRSANTEQQFRGLIMPLTK